MNPAKLSALLWTLCTKIHPEGGTQQVPPFPKSNQFAYRQGRGMLLPGVLRGYAPVLSE